MSDAELGLFPLGVVLLPGERIPLHIFEPRYRALVADCALEDREFVLAYATDDGVAKTACAARIDEVVRRFSDGRMNIVVRGTDRVTLVEQTQGRPYLTARIDRVPDDPSDPDPALEHEVESLFHELASQIAGAPADLPGSPNVARSYVIAGAVELDPLVKQRLLELRTEAERLPLIREILVSALRSVNRQTAADDHGSSNGKVTLQ